MSDPFQGLTAEERKVVNTLSYGSIAAKQEIIIKLIYLGKPDILQKVLNSLTDADYYKVIPLA